VETEVIILHLLLEVTAVAEEILQYEVVQEAIVGMIVETKTVVLVLLLNDAMTRWQHRLE